MLLFSGNNIKPCTHWNLPVSPPLHLHGTYLLLKRVVWDDELDHDFTTTATIINSIWSRPQRHVMRGFFRFLFKCRVCSWMIRGKESRRLTYSCQSVWDYDSTGLWILCVYDGKGIKISESDSKFKFKLCFTSLDHAHCLSQKDCSYMVCFLRQYESRLSLPVPCCSILDALNFVFGMNLLYSYIRELLGDPEAGSRVLWYVLH